VWLQSDPRHFSQQQAAGQCDQAAALHRLRACLVHGGAVSVAVIGWSRESGGSKPVLRVPVQLAVGSDAV